MLFSSAAATLCGQCGDQRDARLRPAPEQRALFHAPPGFEVQLVASEPEIQKPFNLAFDPRGRLWVTGSALYPWPARRDALGAEIEGFQKNWDENHLAFRALSSPPEPPEAGIDSIRVLADFGPDGRARSVTKFVDGLNIPIGVCPLPREPGAKGDTVIAFSIPAIWRFADTDGDGRADRREKLYDGFGFKDTHGMSSNYWLWYDGWIYGTHGFANVSEVTDRNGRKVTLSSGNTYRFRPDGTRFEIYAHGQTNPYGLAFDPRGEVYTADSHSKPVYLLQPGGYYEGIGSWNEHDGLGFAPAITADSHGSSAIAGIAHYAASHFPAEFRDNLFNGNPVTRRVNRTRLDWRGSSPLAVRQPDFLTSDDPAFRPVQVKLGPDGALWIADFYNPIIGHYEAPLTHPDRDRTHGRIWRVVWRGLDGSVPAPRLPDLSGQPTAQLVAWLLDPNTVLRSLAASELLAREDRSGVLPQLQRLAEQIIAGTNPALDPTSLLPIEILLDRLGAADESRLGRALARGESAVAQAALRALVGQEGLPGGFEQTVRTFLDRTPPDRAARLAAALFQRHPQPWQAPLIFNLLERAPEYDVQLRHALRTALKAHAAAASLANLDAWSRLTAGAAARLADVCVAVTTPAAAEFLLGHLERTRFEGERAGEFARHALRSLPVDRFAAVRPLLAAVQGAPITQRLAVAEGLASVASRSGKVLEDELQTWMQRELVAALSDRSAAVVQRAATALKPLDFAGKSEALERVATTESAGATVRVAALRALTPADAATEPLLRLVVSGTGPAGVRRAAAQLLADTGGGPETIDALTRAFADAPADLTVTLATALARTRPGAERLFELVQQKRVPAGVLRHRYVATEIERHPPEFAARVAELTRDVPPENARLDAIIAERLQAYAARKTDRARGAALFTQHCALCHSFQHAGGTLGPSLDGVASRDVARLFEDILDPSRNVDPTFRLVTVTLRNGDTKSGMNYREEGGRVLLTDPSTGETMTLPRPDVSEVAPSPVSAMPAAFETLLSPQELFDLIDYLRVLPKSS